MARLSSAQRRLRNRADALWARVVRLPGRCAICGSTSHVQAHHLLVRERPDTRHDPRNGIPLCVSHHRFSRELSPHKNALPFALWLQEHRPEQWTWIVQMTRTPPDPAYVPDYQAAITALEGLLQDPILSEKPATQTYP